MTIFEALDKHEFEYVNYLPEATKDLADELTATVLWYQYGEDDEKVYFKVDNSAYGDSEDFIIDEEFIDADEFDEYMESFELPKLKFKIDLNLEIFGYSKSDAIAKLEDYLENLKFDYRTDKAITITEIN